MLFRSALSEYDRVFTERFVNSFEFYFKTGDKQHVISLVDSVLKPHGGRLFDGFSIGKEIDENEGK